MDARDRAEQLAGYLCGFAHIFRDFPDDAMWGRPEEAEHCASICEEASATITTLRAKLAAAEAANVEMLRLAVEIERKIDRIHPANRQDSLPVTIKLTRTLGEFKALAGAVVDSLANRKEAEHGGQD